jgi:hypothetical protein
MRLMHALSLLAALPNTEGKDNMVRAVGVQNAALAYKIAPEMFKTKKRKPERKPWDRKRRAL